MSGAGAPGTWDLSSTRSVWAAQLAGDTEAMVVTSQFCSDDLQVPFERKGEVLPESSSSSMSLSFLSPLPSPPDNITKTLLPLVSCVTSCKDEMYSSLYTELVRSPTDVSHRAKEPVQCQELQPSLGVQNSLVGLGQIGRLV